MKKFIFVVVIFAFTQALNAQEKQAKWKFTSMNAMGFMYGEHGGSFTISSVNGIKKKNLVLGIGISYDQYMTATLPIFGEARYFFGRKPWKPFGYLDLGASIPLPNASFPSKWSNGTDAYDLVPGIFGELGLGLEKSINASTAFFMQLGYSQKQFAYYYSSSSISIMREEIVTSRYDYYFRRIAFKMGLRF